MFKTQSYKTPQQFIPTEINCKLQTQTHTHTCTQDNKMKHRHKHHKYKVLNTSFFFFFFFYELKLMYICLFTRAKSGREMTDCILSLPLMTVTNKHLCNISSKKEEKILQSLR